jgi:hypothetical protein
LTPTDYIRNDAETDFVNRCKTLIVKMVILRMKRTLGERH